MNIMAYVNFSIEGLWAFLGNSIAQLFGRECASAAVWMIYCLLLRQITSLFYLQNFVPYGLIFALPYSMHLFGKYCPIMRQSLPLLPLRVSEALLGRLTPLQLTIVIPAHFLGCIFAAALFHCVNPFSPLSALHPITYSADLSLPIILSDALLVALYIIACLVGPELLSVNKLPSAYLTLAVLPFISGVRNGIFMSKI